VDFEWKLKISKCVARGMTAYYGSTGPTYCVMCGYYSASVSMSKSV